MRGTALRSFQQEKLPRDSRVAAKFDGFFILARPLAWLNQLAGKFPSCLGNLVQEKGKIKILVRDRRECGKSANALKVLHAEGTVVLIG